MIYLLLKNTPTFKGKNNQGHNFNFNRLCYYLKRLGRWILNWN